MERQVSPASNTSGSASRGMRWNHLSSSTSLTAAAAHAELLAKRRKLTVGSEDLNMPTLYRSGSTDFEFSPSNFGQEVDIGRFTDSIEALRQDVLAECHDLDKKLDGVISHLDLCFASLIKDIHQKMFDACHLAVSASLQNEDTSRSPRVSFERKQLRPQQMMGRGFGSHRTSNGINISISPPSKPVTTISEEKEDNNKPAENSDVEKDSRDGRKGEKINRQSTNTHRSSLGLGGLLSRVRDRSKLAQLAWLYLEDPKLVPSGPLYVRIMIVFVLASIWLTVVQTVESPPFGRFTEAVLEYLVDGLLTMEILIRFLVAPHRCSFWTNVHNLLDLVNGPLTLLARIVLPFLFPDDVGPNGTATMLLNSCLPTLRLLRLLRRFEGAHLIYTSFKLASEALPELLYVLVVIATASASLLYVLEPRYNIESLPHALWLTVVTLGTVGYGDVTPETPAGKVVICTLVIVSALYMAMPLGIVGKVFSEVWDDRHRLLLTQLARRRFNCMGYSAKDVPALFLSFDHNLDGKLDADEFREMMKQMQFDISGERAIQLFNVFDVDGGGNIEDREFMETLFPEAFNHIYGTSEPQHDENEKDGDGSAQP